MAKSLLSVVFLIGSILIILTVIHWEELRPAALTFFGSSPSELAHGSVVAAVRRLEVLLRSDELAVPLDQHRSTWHQASTPAKKLQYHLAEKHLQTKAEQSESWLQTLQLERRSLRRHERAASSAASALTQLGNFQTEHGRPNAAVLGLQRAVKIMKTVVVEDENDPSTDKQSSLVITAKAEAALAQALCAAGGEKGARQAEAKTLFGEALQIVNGLQGNGGADQESPQVLSAKVHASLAHCLHLNGDLQTAAAMLRVAAVLADEASATTQGRHLIPRVARLLGGVRHDEGSTEEAIRLYEQYLDEMPQSQEFAGDGPNEFVELFETLQDHSLASASLGRRTQALRILDDVLSLQERLNAELRRRRGRAASLKEEGSPDLALLASMARTWQLRAEILLDDDSVEGDRSRLREAVAASSYAIPILKKLRDDGEGLRQLSDALNTHGNALTAVGRAAEAEAAYQQALDLSRELHGDSSPLTAAMLHNLGAAVARQGDNNRALKLLNEALAILKQTLGDNPDVSSALASIASILRKQGETQKSLSTMKEALHIAKKTLPPGHSARKHYEQIVERWEQQELNRRGHVDSSSIIET